MILSLVWLRYAVLVAVKLWERVNVHSYNYYTWKTNEQRSNVHQHYTYNKWTRELQKVSESSNRGGYAWLLVHVGWDVGFYRGG